MQVKVLLFAAHREIMGGGKIDLEVPPRATPEDVYRLLQAQQPAMAQLRPSTTFAINREIAGPSTPLSAGDELALLQPVSGGACD